MKLYVFILIMIISIALIVSGFIYFTGEKKGDASDMEEQGSEYIDFIDGRKDLYETAVFAGGCFWCIEAAFETYTGVINAVSGYTGGDTKDPTYNDVRSGTTGHYEAVMVTYNPLRTSYLDLLDVFFRQIDPTDPDGQFADRGPRYRTAVFYTNEEQRAIVEHYVELLVKTGIYGSDIVTEILPAKQFYEAEPYHQNYAMYNETDYAWYVYGTGRKTYTRETWSDIQTIDQLIGGNRYVRPPENEIREMLTELQYDVTQNKGTESPFDNEYYYNHSDGIYVDIVSGEPLFSSADKYDSGSGWPSFTKPLAPENMRYRIDDSLYEQRIEVTSRYAGSHLGHVFNDGTGETGIRYCINSASLRFIPAEEMEQQGYSRYTYLFGQKNVD